MENISKPSNPRIVGTTSAPKRDIRRSRWLKGAVYVAAIAVTLTAGEFVVHAKSRWEIRGRVNINTAPAKLLTLLPGVGPSRARAIISHRNRRKFRTPRDIMKVKGIGRKSYARMKKFLTVRGVSTIRRVKTGSTRTKVRKANPLGKNGSSGRRGRNKGTLRR